MSKPHKICLIDASSIIHRAFHALPPLATGDGFPTGAVLGFVKMLQKVLREGGCDRVAVAYDAKGPTFRHELDPVYKANRPPMDPDLAKQIPVIREIVEASGLAGLECPGYEADDIIATLTREAGEAGEEVLIVSGDKDLMQLLGPRVAMWDTMKDKTLGPAEVEERYGVEPERLPDVFGLIGDTSDNIPGVPGIGPKTAGQLIQEFGDLETLLARAGEIKQPKRRQSLLDHAPAARLSKELFILRSDLDLKGFRERLTPGRPDRDRLAEIFGRLEMGSLLAELGGEAEGQTPEMETSSDLEGLIKAAREQGRVGLALALGGPRPLTDRLASLTLALDRKAVVLKPKDGRTGEWLKPVAPLLEEEKVAKAGFDLKAAWLALSRQGVNLRGRLFDPLLADYLLNPGRRSRTPALVAADYLGRGRDLNQTAQAAGAALELHRVLEEKLKETEVDRVFDEIETPLLPVLARMEEAGVAVDRDILEELSTGLGERLDSLHRRIMEAAGHEFNPNSPQQLSQVLFQELGLPQGRKTAKKTGYSTSVSVLEELKNLHPLPGLILDHRALTKLKTTYVDALMGLVNPETGRIHTTFNQAVAATGRLSSSDPNLQNIPIRTEEGHHIRRAFVAGPGRVLISADYSQIELRLLAHYSQDPALTAAFREGRDVHLETAVRVFEVGPEAVDAELRRRAKIVNFSLIYGKTAFGLSQDLGISQNEAARFIEAYFARFGKVKDFWEEAVAGAGEKGYVTTLLGRRRYLPEIRSSNWVARQAAERMAVNTIFQGSAADLIKVAMIRLDRAISQRGLKARMILQVHDELVVEAPEAEADQVAGLVKEIMEKAESLRVPLVVEVGRGRNWDEAH